MNRIKAAYNDWFSTGGHRDRSPENAFKGGWEYGQMRSNTVDEETITDAVRHYHKASDALGEFNNFVLNAIQNYRSGRIAELEEELQEKERAYTDLVALRLKMTELESENRELLKVAKHLFVTNNQDVILGNDDRYCQSCGLYITHPVHQRGKVK